MNFIKFFLFPIIQFVWKIYNFLVLYLTNSRITVMPQINGFLVRRGNGQLTIGDKVKINSSLTSNPVGLTTRTLFYIEMNGFVSIGNNVGISNSLFYAKTGILIEDDVLIGGGCQILDNDFHGLSYTERVINQDTILPIPSGKITIKKGAFIGASCIILKGVTIGEKSILGAGSVLSKSIPDFEIWAGNPARFIKKIVL